MAVKLISGQDTGSISLEVVGKELDRSIDEAERAATRARKEAERAAEEGQLTVWVIPSDGVETGMLILKLTITDLMT